MNLKNYTIVILLSVSTTLMSNQFINNSSNENLEYFSNLEEIQIIKEAGSYPLTPSINFRDKVFFSKDEGTGTEFIEFRIFNSYDNFDKPGSGVGGIAAYSFENNYGVKKYVNDSNNDLLLWSENGRNIRFITQSNLERDFGMLGTTRMIIHSIDGETSPISFVNSYLNFPEAGITIEPQENGNLLFKSDGFEVFQINSEGYLIFQIKEILPEKCKNNEHIGRVAFNGEGIFICTEDGWSN